ncbi:hypothetical protein M3936_16545 [Sutcliffiella horikoshii]|nr:hypothetical protein [Sutcliffiella horikoshii]MCM3619200.1 hypothetical protein [Sutcliffiella horikoshii]
MNIKFVHGPQSEARKKEAQSFLMKIIIKEAREIEKQQLQNAAERR